MAASSANPTAEMVAAIKTKFRELDVDRDGHLNIEELGNMLKKGSPNMSDKEIRSLFTKADSSGTGRVSFDEFVDFVFQPPKQKAPKTQKEWYQQKVKEMASIGDKMLKEVSNVEIVGAEIHTELNGVFSKVYDELYNGMPLFDRGFPESVIFYGWTQGKKKVGWFIARKKPKVEGAPVLKYKVFSASPLAQMPMLCYASWRTTAGVKEGTMFCEAVDRTPWDNGCTSGKALAEELCTQATIDVESLVTSGIVETDFDEDWLQEAGEELDDVDGAEAEGYDGEQGVVEEAKFDGEIFTDGAFNPNVDKSILGSPKADGWMRLTSCEPACSLLARVNASDIYCEADSVNYWFLSALATVAEYPAFLQTMFGRVTKLTPDHRYTVRLYHPGKGAFQQVEIDDYVPTQAGRPYFAGMSLDNEIWVALVEKAFAKMCGGYDNLSKGSVLWGLLYLCGGGGAECWRQENLGEWKRYKTKWTGLAQDQVNRESAEELEADTAVADANALWELLRKYMELCFPVACRIRAGIDQVAGGLVSDRHYTLLGAREVQVQDQVLRMVFLRNPFGIGEWQGRFSDKSDAWQTCPAAKQQLRFKPEPDGCFYMPFSDFVKYFDQVDLATKVMPVQGCHRQKYVGMRRGLGMDTKYAA